MASRGEELHETLLSLSLQVREIRGLALVDQDGLILVSTLGSAALDENLGAFGGAVSRELERAQRDFVMGPMYLAHFVGRDRQLFVSPVNAECSLVAIVESQATPATVTMHLLALARQLIRVLSPQEEKV